MLRLIRERGTIVNLFKILENSTPAFAAGLIAALDGPIVQALIEKTIEAGSSIGTLHLAVREQEEGMVAHSLGDERAARRNDDFVHLGGEELQVTVGETRKERDLSEVID